MWFHGVMVSTLDFESSDPSSNLGGTSWFYRRKSVALSMAGNERKYFHVLNRTDGRQIKGTTNIESLNKVLGHHMKLECALTLILQVSKLSWRNEHHSCERYSLIW